MKTLGDLLKDVKKSIIDEVDQKDPVIALDKNEDGLVVTKSSGTSFTIDLGFFNADMANLAKGEKGDRGERGLTVKGDRGEPGRAGNSIIDIRFDQRGHLIIETVDKTYDLGLLQGGGGTQIVKDNEVNLTGDVLGTTDDDGITVTTLQPTDNVLSIINNAPTYEYPELTVFDIRFPTGIYEIGDIIPDGDYYINTFIEHINNASGVSDTGVTELSLMDQNRDILKTFEYYVREGSSASLESIGYNFTRSTVGNYKFTLNGLNTKGEVFSKVFLVPFVDRIYYGSSSEQVLNAMNINIFDSELSFVETPEKTEISYSASSNTYKWICLPARLGSNYVFRDTITGIQILMEESDDLDITNDYGVTTTYKTYKSVNMLAGEIQLSIIY